MILKPQDLLVLLKLVVLGRSSTWTYNKLAVELGMSPAEVHAAIKRALSARLAVEEEDGVKPNIRNLREFLVHGLRYFAVPERGGLTRGMPTAASADPLVQSFGPAEYALVWPDPDGEMRGEAFSPLYRSAPKAARRDPQLYELLALVDAIRAGPARERSLATELLSERLQAYG